MGVSKPWQKVPVKPGYNFKRGGEKIWQSNSKEMTTVAIIAAPEAAAETGTVVGGKRRRPVNLLKK